MAERKRNWMGGRLQQPGAGLCEKPDTAWSIGPDGRDPAGEHPAYGRDRPAAAGAGRLSKRGASALAQRKRQRKRQRI